jgi:NAD+ diphosphatase
MKSTFIPAVAPPTHHTKPALWFAFAGDKLLVYAEDAPELVPSLIDFSELGLPLVSQQYLGLLDDRHCYSVELEPDTPAPPSMAFEGLRQLFDRLDHDLFAVAGRAIQVMAWDRDHQFCGRCGSPLDRLATERAKCCPQCGLHVYPRIAPCIIVRISRGDELLLARGHKWPPGRFSVIAGFVEPGETLEEAVAREVREEVGVQVKNVRYFGSQPWPFPHSLMIGFTAEYAGGDLRIEEAEIEDAGWFSLNNLPVLPTRISIARQLIEAFINGT